MYQSFSCVVVLVQLALYFIYHSFLIFLKYFSMLLRLALLNLGHESIYLFIYLFLTSLLEYNCFTMVCQFVLYNKVNQLYIYIYPHISSLFHLPPTLPIPPLQVVTKHRADLPVLCSCFPLAIYFAFGSVYMSMPLSHFVPSYLSPSPYPQVHSLVGLHLYSRLAPRFFMTIFLFGFQIPYICVSILYLFFSF